MKTKLKPKTFKRLKLILFVKRIRYKIFFDSKRLGGVIKRRADAIQYSSVLLPTFQSCFYLFSCFKLTETSSRYARKISGTTALQEALKEKQQHIEQLLAERDLERAEVAKANSHICEVEKELSVLKAQHGQV